MIEINWHDFPDDVYVLFKEGFRAKFFKTAWKINRSYRHLAKKLGVSNPTMLSWRRGKSKGQDQYISTWDIKDIINHSKHSEDWKFTSETIQNNIKSVRARAGTHKIYDLNLPIKDSIELREIVVHLLCDGCALNDKHRTSKYALINKKAVEEFKERLKIFGEQPTLQIIKEDRKEPYQPAYILKFSKAITKILINKFKINFRSKEAKLPPDFLQGDRKLLVAIIRAFLIDEGCVKDRNIIFCSGSLELLKNLVVVCNNLGYKCQKLKKNNNVYYLDISPDSFEKAYNDLMSIGPLPIKEKQELLDLGIKIIKSKSNFSELNQQIKNILKEKPSTKLDIAKILFVNTKTIGQRLSILEKQSIVKKSDKRNEGKGGAFIWKLTSSGV